MLTSSVRMSLSLPTKGKKMIFGVTLFVGGSRPSVPGAGVIGSDKGYGRGAGFSNTNSMVLWDREGAQDDVAAGLHRPLLVAFRTVSLPSTDPTLPVSRSGLRMLEHPLIQKSTNPSLGIRNRSSIRNLNLLLHVTTQGEDESMANPTAGTIVPVETTVETSSMQVRVPSPVQAPAINWPFLASMVQLLLLFWKGNLRKTLLLSIWEGLLAYHLRKFCSYCGYFY
ncbi:hypothetical protein NE237_021225 [Protea cynaroides]|uniref:Uncharacterized protein n=1 Tax=Protea cynaroides TaxID=273540 RepID=A0A9Q0HAX2_9MAGN|nr:hypothetical protein NE237_021225 [Protea cynaroides]